MSVEATVDFPHRSKPATSYSTPAGLSWRKHEKGWIWPRDGRPGRSKVKQRLSMISDIFSGKGPDIFVGYTDSRAPRPSRQLWSGWHQLHPRTQHLNDNFQLPLDEQLDRERWNPYPSFGANRTGQVYDFRSRRYRTIYDHDALNGYWSNVRWCHNKDAQLPLYFDNAFGYRTDLSTRHTNPWSRKVTCFQHGH